MKRFLTWEKGRQSGEIYRKDWTFWWKPCQKFDNTLEVLEILITMIRKTFEQGSALVKKLEDLENKSKDEQAVQNKEFIKKLKNLENMIKKNIKNTVEQLNCSEC